MTDARAAEIEVLWLDALQQVAGRATHEIKGALNGVCVNLEVVRNRATNQATGRGPGLARFAAAAASQLDQVVVMNEALLALVRRPRDVVDVLATAGHLVALLGPVARADGYSLTVVAPPVSGGGVTSAPAAAVRLVLASVMLRALDRRTATTCRVDAGDGMVLHVECADGSTIDLDSRVAQAAAEAGIRIEGGPGGLSLAFPRAGRSSGRRSASTREIA